MNRRKFLTRSVSALVGGGMFWALHPRWVAAAIWKEHRKWSTLEALMDTVVPGKFSDPTGAPGALEAESFEFLNRLGEARFLPFTASLLSFPIVLVLNFLSVTKYQKRFSILRLEERTEILASIQGVKGVPVFLRLLRAPFYTASVNSVGYDYLGFPGKNQGYRDFSFEQVLGFSEEEVFDGNLP